MTRTDDIASGGTALMCFIRFRHLLSGVQHHRFLPPVGVRYCNLL